MSEMIQIVPCFTLQNMKLVGAPAPEPGKGSGDPVDIAGYLARHGASRIAFFDVDSPRERLEKWVSVFNRIAGVNLELIFGSNMNDYEEYEKLLEGGIRQVALDVYANTDPSIIDRLSRTYGSERVLVAVNGRKNPAGSSRPPFEIIHRTGETATELDLIEWIKAAEMLGAGGLIVNSNDRTGRGEGYDIEMLKAVTSVVTVPVIASGGAGELEHFYQVVKEAGVAGVAASSGFISGRFTPADIKQYLEGQGIRVAG